MVVPVAVVQKLYLRPSTASDAAGRNARAAARRQNDEVPTTTQVQNPISPLAGTNSGSIASLIHMLSTASATEKTAVLSLLQPSRSGLADQTLISMNAALGKLSSASTKDTVPNFHGDQRDVYTFIRSLKLNASRWNAPGDGLRIWLLSKFKKTSVPWAEKTLAPLHMPSTCDEFCRLLEAQ